MRRAALSLLLLAACAPVADPRPVEPRLIGPPEVAPPPGADDPCGATRFALWAGLAGQALTDRVAADRLRLIRPGDRVSTDFRADRLNAELDDAGRIVRLYCG